MKRNLLKIIFFTTLLFFAVDEISAKENDKIYWNSETGKMENTSSLVTINSSFSKDEVGFSTMLQASDKPTFLLNWEKNQDFTVNVDINVQKSTMKTSLINFRFTGAYSSVASYSADTLNVFGTRFEIPGIQDVTSLKLKFQYFSKTSILTYSSETYPEISGSYENSGLLKGIDLGNANNFNYYNGFEFEIISYEELTRVEKLLYVITFLLAVIILINFLNPIF